MSIPGTIAACLSLLLLLAAVAVAANRERFTEWLRGLFRELVYAWRDVTREMP